MARVEQMSKAGDVTGWPDLTQSATFEIAQRDNEIVGIALPSEALFDVENAIACLTSVVLALYPAWLREAKDIDGWAGSGKQAVLEIARAAARRSDLYGPVLEHFALAALNGETLTSVPGVPYEAIARECGKLILSAYARKNLLLIVTAPVNNGQAKIDKAERTALWLAQHIPARIWITGPAVISMNRISKPEANALLSIEACSDDTPEITQPPPWVSPIEGRPNPFSEIEQRLEAHLGAQLWSSGRAWNVSWQASLTENPILVDLMWTEERLVVEIDGPEHRAPAKFEADRRRDRLLQVAGFAVLRFTNSEVETDIGLVASQIEAMLTQRRSAHQS